MNFRFQKYPDMKKFLVLFFIGMFIPVAGDGADIDFSKAPGYEAAKKDTSKNGKDIPDLLTEDPYIIDPVPLSSDPVFEDDFSLNKPPLRVSDPLESLNRVFFIFNDRLYFWVLKPASTAYAAVLPEDIRLVVGNFFNNLAAPIRFINNILQGEIEEAGVVLGRFLINSTMGVFGLGDVAYREFSLEPRDADFGQTLGKWGIGGGIYLCVPFLGPLNVRDGVGFVADAYMHPVPYITDDATEDAVYLMVGRLNALSVSPPVYEELKRSALDPYVAARQAYYEYRNSIIESH